MQTTRYTYDAFISHAVEDKLAIANELAIRLEAANLKIWYSGNELSVGDLVNNTVEKGLSSSRYGIIILSKTYIEKSWTMRELFTFMGRPEGHKRILPILYDITVDELAAKHLPLADIYALRYEKGMDFIVEKIVAEITSGKVEPVHPVKQKTLKWFNWKYGLLGACITALVSLLAFQVYDQLEPALKEEMIKRSIVDHIAEFDERVQLLHATAMQVERGRVVSRVQPDSLLTVYHQLKGKFRNEYTLQVGSSEIKGRRNVESALQLDLAALMPINDYKLDSATRFLFGYRTEEGNRIAHYSYVNALPVQYTIEKQEQVDPLTYRVTVKYQEHIRMIDVRLQFPKAGELKKHMVAVAALPPQETFVFRNEGGEWIFKQVE